MYVGNKVPSGWALCDGALLGITENEALWSLIGNKYGGDGTTNFAVPDLRNRTPIGMGQGPGLAAYEQGSKEGRTEVSITKNNFPADDLGYKIPAFDTNPEEVDENHQFEHGNNSFISVGNQSNATITATAPVMRQSSLSKMQPSLQIYFLIALEGRVPNPDW